MLDLFLYGGTDPFGYVLFFLSGLLIVFSAVFRRLNRLGSFPACWRQANVTPIPKSPPSFSVANYLPITITPLFFKLCERLGSVRSLRFIERGGVLPTTKFGCRKGLGTSDALLCESKVHWSVSRRLGLCRVTSAQPLIGSTIRVLSYKLCSVGILVPVLFIVTQFLSN